MYELRVASLNFSGINISPFEYHDGSEQKNSLNRLFKEEFDNYNSKYPGEDWNIAKIDKIFSKERYSILYRPDCGYVRGKFLNQQKFDSVWDRTFDLNQGIVGHTSLDEALVNRLRSFDWMAYKAFFRFVFGITNFENLEQYDFTKYTQQLKKWHSKSYLSQDKKLDFVKDYILQNDIDVMFIQEANNKRCEDYLPNSRYSFVSNADSLIIHKNDTYFTEDRDDIDLFNLKYKQKLNFNKDTTFLKSKNILLISSHLSSKNVNIQQAKHMFDILNDIQEQYKDLIIIMGIDANHQIENNRKLKVFPDTKTPTTRKKRTHMQCQFQKAGKLVEETKDYIVTSAQTSSWRIETIKSWKVSTDLLPNNQHPFDHFVISAVIQFDKSKHRSLCRGNTMFTTYQIRIQHGQSTVENFSATLIPVSTSSQQFPTINRRRTFSDDKLKLDLSFPRHFSLRENSPQIQSYLLKCGERKQQVLKIIQK